MLADMVGDLAEAQGSNWRVHSAGTDVGEGQAISARTRATRVGAEGLDGNIRGSGLDCGRLFVATLVKHSIGNGSWATKLASRAIHTLKEIVRFRAPCSIKSRLCQLNCVASQDSAVGTSNFLERSSMHVFGHTTSSNGWSRTPRAHTSELCCDAARLRECKVERAVE